MPLKLPIRGLSLVEILVVMSLLGVITVLIAGLFSNSMRISAREAQTLEIEQSCHFLLQRIESDLQSSGTAGISYLSSEQWSGGAINPIEDVTSEGSLTWENRQIFYLWSSRQRALFKLERNGDSSILLSNPRVFSSEELLSIASSNSPESAQIGQGVSDFSLLNERPDGSGRVVTLSIEFTRLLPQEQERRFRLTKSLALLN